MRFYKAILIISYLVLFILIQGCTTKIEYPVTKTVDVVDDYHGTKVADPYRWLEDDNSTETKQWVTAQNKVTFAYLEKISSREKIKARLTELWNYEKFDLPYKMGGSYFFEKNDGLQNQYVLYTQKTLDSEAKVLLNPNLLSKDGTVALTDFEVSNNGKYLLYSLSSAGSDWREFHILDVESGKNLNDHLKWIKFSEGVWTKDSDGFYYARYPSPKEGATFVQQNKYQKLYYHKLGATQNKDILIYEEPNHPDRGFAAEVTNDGKYLIINVWEGTDERNRIYYMKIGSKRKGKVVKLLDEFDASYTFIDNDGKYFYFRTDLNAPKGKVVKINIRKPQKKYWQTIIPAQEDVVDNVYTINNQLIVELMHNAHNIIKIYNKDGSFDTAIELPALGSISGISGNKNDTEMFYKFQSFSYPSTIYRYDFKARETSILKAPEVKFNPDDYQTKQVFFKSKDGTEIPMFISYKKDTEINNTPTYLYGYGGFNISLTPRFKISNLFWMEMGGIYVYANLRGGGEFGMKWYEQGILANKQNVFDDFIAAAEYLIAENYTSKEKIAIGGGSNGGLLVGACMTQRPDLFAAAIPEVGVMDMLRYHKFTIGWAWAADYGRSDNPEHFKFLYDYSPLHNLKEGVSYPATMITTADHDDRVVPAHSFKFAAQLQKCHVGNNPVIIRIETKAGHGAGKPTSKRIEEQTDKWAFLAKNLKMKY